MQERDVLTKKAGYQSLNTLSRIFLMRKQLDALVSNYDADEHIKRFLESLPGICDPEKVGFQGRKVQKFLELSRDDFSNMFSRWELPALAFLVAFAETETGVLVANHLLGKQHDRDNLGTYHSKVHNTAIDLKQFIEFLEERVPTSATPIPGIERCSEVLELISKGPLNIWDSDNQDSKIHVMKLYAAFASNAQAVERAVKAQNVAASNQRGEKNVGIRLAATGLLMEMSE